MGPRPYVLVVDDEQAILDVLSAQLRNAGFEVREFLSGEAALEACKEDNHVPDVLVADLMLSGMTGVETASRLSLLFPSLQVLFISGYTGTEFFRQRGISLNDVPFLQKPFAPDALVDRVRQLVSGQLSTAASD